MLQAYQIQKLAKAYSDRQLVKQSSSKYKGPKLFDGGNMWANGFVAFREPLPSKTVSYLGNDGEIIPAPDGFFAKIEQEVERLNCPVEPVELRPLARAYDKEIVIAKMQNCTCAGWVDAGYISAVLKRHKKHVARVSKRKSGAVVIEPESRLTWKAFDGGVVALIEGEIVAVVMGLNLKEQDLQDAPDWLIRSEGD